MIDAGAFQILYAALSPLLGIFLLSVCTEGYFMRKIRPWERLLAGCAALAAITPGLGTDLLAVAVFLILYLKNKTKKVVGTI